FWSDWKKIAVPNGTGFEAKAHRPVMVFDHVGGSNIEEWEYKITTATGLGWTIGSTDDPDDFGLKIDPGAHPIRGSAQYNAIGREHPGGDKFGGTTNFLYVDGGVARTTVFNTMRNREWGESYYSLSGPSEIAYNR
ncbi:MAG: hypothetical protein JXO22_09900, partial [Phycisphaerae bacterium]|nr:hypothetical protein [Phycisphaerae bacterium]